MSSSRDPARNEQPHRQRRGKKAGLPFVFVNFAITADGKITTANRKVTSFSSPRDREHMYELRVDADAVMAGARTVDLNPVTMGPGGEKYQRERVRRGLSEYNLRIVVSGSGTVDPKAKLFQKQFSPIIILTTKRASRQRIEELRRHAREVKVFGETEIDFEAALRWLRREWKVRTLLCEGGGELNDALFRAGLVNELHLTICPTIIGGRDAPTMADGCGQARLADASKLDLKWSKRYGDELFLIYKVR
ncbi:MAG TPA: dihydrofolate reductase family protein [Verrucomicrobiae bacterium]|nr:dihydrofolate reductase family protein [Verrucomicrobiae bacterium]